MPDKEGSDMFCQKCGAQTRDNEVFCLKCGAALTPLQKPEKEAVAPSAFAQPTAVTTQQTQPFAPVMPPVQPKNKTRKIWPAVLTASLGTVLIAAVLILLFTGVIGTSAAALPETAYSYLTDAKEVVVDFNYAKTVYPSLYPSMDSVVNFHATSEGGNTQVLIRAEIPGFTQVYEQKLTLTEQITQFYIKPPVLTGQLNLDSSKDAQIIFSVTDVDTGKPYVQESAPIKLMSKYDFILWEDEFGEYSLDNALAWLTPESDGILELRRNAIDWLDNATDGRFNTLQGYQYSSLFGPDEYYKNVLFQILGLQGAMSDMGVRYNVGAFSMTEGQHQRVLLPDDVLSSKSGICIETSLVMASALQSAGMHAMLIFPPGHAQVAVETWQGSGEYYLVETTVLPFTAYDDYANVVRYMDSDEWLDYLSDPWQNGSGPCYVLDCDLATKLGIVALTN